jgi:iron complex outermembrane receptor protein
MSDRSPRASSLLFHTLLALCLAGAWGTQAFAQANPPSPPADAQASSPPQTQADQPKTPPQPPVKATPAAKPQDAKGPKDSGQLQRVEVIGNVSDAEQRRASTAAKIVIGREEIERFGDSSIGEVLKRLPGVTTGGRPGRGGDPRMRGMGGGYTQLLVNGERMPPGFSLGDLPPDQVERIEVLRAPTAEYGTRAVAGTINIVLKEALRRTLNEVRAGVASEEGRLSPSASWTRNDKLGEAIAYTLTLSVNHSNRVDDYDVLTRWTDLQSGASLLDQRETGFSQELRDGLHLNGRVQWTLGEGESLVLMPFMVVSKGSTHVQHHLDQAPGGAVAQPYASYVSDGDGSFGMLRTNVQYQKRFGEAVRLDVRAGVGRSKMESSGLRQEFDLAGLPSRSVDDRTDTREDSWSLNSKLAYQWGDDHSLVGGLELDSSARAQGRTTLQNGLPILIEFGDELNASTRRMAAYAQDEWNVNKQISAYAGLRWEGIETRSDSSSYAANNLSSVVTPLLHATWRPSEQSRDQWRSSLTRSYKSATLSDLIARPSLSQRFPSGANEVGSPDRAGNPNLRPELASGVELAYEHYLGKGGLMSVNLFYRRISDLMRNVVALETVSWSNQPRWVSRPQNVGQAVTQGVELEAKFRLDELLDDALPIAVHSNLSFFHSSVDQVTGPNNRLEGQPAGTANIGADYRLRSLPISFGGSVNVTPGYETRLSDIQTVTVGAKVVADAFVLWFINPATQLRLSANNLLPRDYFNTSSLVNGTQRQDNQTANASKVNWGLRLEMKL